MTEKRLSLPLPWPEVWRRLEKSLSDSGLELVRSFDLQSARSSLAEPDLCPCPYHGTSNCNCQYMVWLVRREGGAPLSLAIHGHDDCTYITISGEGDAQADEGALGPLYLAIRGLTPITDPPSP